MKTYNEGMAAIEAWWKELQEVRHTPDDPITDDAVILQCFKVVVTAADLRAVFNNGHSDRDTMVEAARANLKKLEPLIEVGAISAVQAGMIGAILAMDGMPPSARSGDVGDTAVTDGWQPIETAPKNGREVLLRVKQRAGIEGCFLVGHYMGGGHCIEGHPPIGAGWFFWNGCFFDEAAEPTHWMPLPAVPAPEVQP